VLGRVVEPREKPLLLVVRGDVQQALDDGAAAVSVGPFEVVDRAVTPLDLVRRGELANPGDQHVLVLRPVEDADLPGGRQRLLDAPQEVVLELLGCRLLERRDAQPLRIDQAGRVPDGAALARGVHALEDEQDRAWVVSGPVRVQPFLEIGQLVADVRHRLLGVVLVAVESGRGARVDVGEHGDASQQLTQ
jgi:hypothetical protein